MPFDGSGNFTRTQDWTNDALAAVKIRADRHDSNDDDIAAGLSQCITKNGTTTVSADIPFNGKKLINVANPVNPQDAATKNSSETFASAVRNFNTAVNLTGTSTGVSPNFVSRALLAFTEADMSIVARKADAAATPPTVNRICINDNALGTGTDVFTFTEDGVKFVDTLLLTSGNYVKANSPGLKYLEILEAVGGGGMGGSSQSTGPGQMATGGGGGGGARGRHLFAAASLAASVAYTIASAAGSTTFGSLTLGGGSNGGLGGATSGASIGVSGAGGVASGAWSFASPGGQGFYGWSHYTNLGFAIRGHGANSPYGGGGADGVTSGASAGQAATGYGAGGGGASAGPSAASCAGGAGSGGFILIREWF